jgi:DNA-binding transcriptional LysR family regulator
MLMPRSSTSVHVPSPDPVGELLRCDASLLELTFDQLRTLLLVRETGSALRTARQLGREQSSVQKQLDTLNRHFQRLCGELLVVKQRRGQDVLLTPTGHTVTALADELFADWTAGVQDCRRRLGRTLTVGTTEFTLGFLGQIWPRVRGQLRDGGIDLKVVHVRTRQFWEKLDSKEVDLLCGGLATPAGQVDIAPTCDFIEWHRGSLALLTNLTPHGLPAGPVGPQRLRTLPLVIPAAGIIVDFLRRWYGAGYRDQLTVAAEIDDIYYGLGLLRSRLVSGCMIVTRSVGERALKGGLPSGSDFRLVELGDDFRPRLELVTGVFARKGERDQFAPSHPLNILWDAFASEATLPASPPV